LERRFYCPRDGKEVTPNEIVRGYELEDGSYVVVDDAELEAIEPQKTREMDLREFIDLTELPPTLLERGYYVTPLKEATKAYRLLAEVTEQTKRAGIASFVMRDREYLVAIFARDGILCGETLRFADEIRDPHSIGLPAPLAAPSQRVSAFEQSINALLSKTLPLRELADQATEALKAIIEKKRKAGRDLVRTDHEVDAGASDQEGEIDLLETIRQNLRRSGKQSNARPSGRPSPTRGGPLRSDKHNGPTKTKGGKNSPARGRKVKS
jgi:DNA end-binding protein Ku